MCEIPEYGASTVLRNVGIQPPYYTAQQPRKPQYISFYLYLFLHRTIWYWQVKTLRHFIFIPSSLRVFAYASVYFAI